LIEINVVIGERANNFTHKNRSEILSCVDAEISIFQEVGMTNRIRRAFPVAFAGAFLILVAGCTNAEETSSLRSQVVTAEEAAKAAQSAAEASTKAAQDAAASAQAAARAAEQSAASANAAADKADRIFKAAQRK
jgi:hypothetical protein